MIRGDAVNEQDLVSKLLAVEARLAPPVIDDEAEAAPDPRTRILQRREAIERTDPPIEHHFQIKEPHQRRVFTALLRRYGLVPYRYPRQSERDVMVQLSMAFESQLLAPIHAEMKAEVAAFFVASMERVAGQALYWDTSDAGQATDDVPRSYRRG